MVRSIFGSIFAILSVICRAQETKIFRTFSVVQSLPQIVEVPCDRIEYQNQIYKVWICLLSQPDNQIRERYEIDAKNMTARLDGGKSFKSIPPNGPIETIAKIIPTLKILPELKIPIFRYSEANSASHLAYISNFKWLNDHHAYWLISKSEDKIVIYHLFNLNTKDSGDMHIIRKIEFNTKKGLMKEIWSAATLFVSWLNRDLLYEVNRQISSNGFTPPTTEVEKRILQEITNPHTEPRE